MKVNDILSAVKRWATIPVSDIVAACEGSHVKRGDLEARIVAAGYFYAISEDAFMPPSWVQAQRAMTREEAMERFPNAD